jgi:cellulose biosynthesis protein BcsQ/tetratricopeptide (TPR) repeat protein
MYVVTFYSFKGGVGRTMALVNVAYELAQTGRRVLMVDMDLEAPGLDTFNLPQAKQPVPGVVDFVTRYRATGSPPDVSEFLYSSPLESPGKGGLWIMPAGLQDGYESRFHAIDWQRLYANEEGYLLFEDLKGQWNAVIQPDYVLIDSRTGHTDVRGICTRQLPDAVVMLFFPNEQNRRGLEKLVRDIRAEASPPRNKKIELHFVMSNVPDLDDEDRILADSLKRTRHSLGFDELTATIHHYSSLSLLNQMVFTAQRPRSRLAEQYRQLAHGIIKKNTADRDGALDVLSEIMPSSLRVRFMAETPIEDVLTNIQKEHNTDGEVLFRLAQVRRRQRRSEEARTLLDQAITAGFTNPEAYLLRAELRASSGSKELAVADIKAVLDSPAAHFFEVGIALRLLLELDAQAITILPASAGLQNLDIGERLQIIDELLTRPDTLPVAESILHTLYQSPGRFEHKAQNYLILSLIGQGKYREAKSFINLKPDLTPNDPTDAFNYAMAEWGATGHLRPDLLQPLSTASITAWRSANHKQGAAIAYWAAGQTEIALLAISDARQQIMNEPSPEFSAWRYLRVTPDIFLADLDAEAEMIKGSAVLPEFIQRHIQERSTP